jgi:predicted nucleic acid-binding protein
VKRFVLDASVSLRWFLDNPVPAYALRMKQHLSGGARAVVPSLWHLEMANAFVVAERRGMLTPDDADLCVAQTEELAAHWIESATELSSTRAAFTAARAFHLSSYDATYLELARRSGLPLATLDQPLRAAAAQAGVELVR